MRVKLYVDNDSRPRGDYENVVHAEQWSSMLCFTSHSGKKFHTNLRYLLEVETGDQVVNNGGFIEVIGRPKPLRSKEAKQNEMFRHEQDDFDDK